MTQTFHNVTFGEAPAKCMHCNGYGLIGGFVGSIGSGAEGYDSELCPTCNGTGKERPIPAQLRRHPAGCPDADWCRGNAVCHWDCEGRLCDE